MLPPARNALSCAVVSMPRAPPLTTGIPVSTNAAAHNRASLVPLLKFISKIGIEETIEKQVNLNQCQNILYPVGMVLKIIVAGVISGCRHLSHLTSLEIDPVVMKAAGWQTVPGGIDHYPDLGTIQFRKSRGAGPSRIQLETKSLEIIDLDLMVDLAEAVRLTGGRVALCGYFDPVVGMLQGDPGDVCASIMGCLETGDDRLFCMDGCQIPGHAPPELGRPEPGAQGLWGLMNRAQGPHGLQIAIVDPGIQGSLSPAGFDPAGFIQMYVAVGQVVDLHLGSPIS